MKKIILGIGTLALVFGTFGLLANSASAYRGDPSVQGPYYSTERHEAMEKAFENNDYKAWKDLMQDKGRVMQVINESNFAQFAKAHELAEEGNMTEAQKIRQELGLGLRNGQGNLRGNGMGRCGNR